jgi:hypothetical protein
MLDGSWQGCQRMSYRPKPDGLLEGQTTLGDLVGASSTYLLAHLTVPFEMVVRLHGSHEVRLRPRRACIVGATLGRWATRESVGRARMRG